MKRVVAYLLTWALSSISVVALPLANPALPTLFAYNSCQIASGACNWCDDVALRLGYYGDFVFNRHMENSLPATIHKTELWTNAALIDVNFCNRFDLFATFGASRLRFEAYTDALRSNITFPSFRLMRLESNARFSWSLGARASVWDYGCLGIGLEGQYFRTQPPANSLSDGIVFLEYPHQVRMRFREWQLGLGAFYRVECTSTFVSAAVPYVGIKWSDARLDMQNSVVIDPNAVSAVSNVTLFTMNSKRHVGYALGVTTVFCNRFELSVEGRFRDERALYVNGELSF
jgi:major outer membrane protein